MKTIRLTFVAALALSQALLVPACVFGQTPAQLTIDASAVIGDIDLSAYSLSQGGQSAKRMLASHVSQLQQIHPRSIRFFMWEYYHPLTARGVYHWTTLDSMLDDIVATGAKPIPAIDFKPKLLYPDINSSSIIPNSWADWDTMICELVRHCKQKGYGIQYWEIGNEPECNDGGAGTYNPSPRDYALWYGHTANAIRRADPQAKVGGPALCGTDLDSPGHNAMRDTLIAYCARGNAPLDFLSFHFYGSSLDWYGQYFDKVKALLAQNPAMSNVGIMVTEWNMALDQGTAPVLPVFVIRATRMFHQKKLLTTAYYHIRDWRVDINEFSDFLPASGATLMRDWWNGSVPRGGLFDFSGTMQASFHVFGWLWQIKGSQLQASSGSGDIGCMAAKNGGSVYAIIWNGSGGTSYDVTINLPSTTAGSFILKRLNFASAGTQTLRSGAVGELAASPLRLSLGQYGIGWLEINAATATTPHTPAIASPMTSADAVLYDLRGRRAGFLSGPAAKASRTAPGAGVFFAAARNGIGKVVAWVSRNQ